MNELFKIYRFRYKNKFTLPLDVYARSEETADKVVYWWNKDLPIEQQWYKPRFRFRHKELTAIPPYEFEQMQLESAQELYERRKECEKAECEKQGECEQCNRMA